MQGKFIKKTGSKENLRNIPDLIVDVTLDFVNNNFIIENSEFDYKAELETDNPYIFDHNY